MMIDHPHTIARSFHVVLITHQRGINITQDVVSKALLNFKIFKKRINAHNKCIKPRNVQTRPVKQQDLLVVCLVYLLYTNYGKL